MQRHRSGVMFRFPEILCCFLVVGWATSAIARSEKLFQRSSNQQKELASLVKNFQPARAKRAAEPACPPDRVVTDETAQDDLLPAYYTPEELDACLPVEVLKRNLLSMSYYAWEEEYIGVIKAKLNQTGYPDSVLRNLGGFMEFMGPEDVKEWPISSADTLAALLGNDPAPKPELATAVLSQYLNSGGVLNAVALNAIGSDICLLAPEQLQKIDKNAIKGAKPLDLSNCDQTAKDILYPTAKRAFSDQHNKNPGYYNLIKPYLGGAPADDLRALGKYNINMDIDTFMGLKPESIMQTTPATVKALLGTNLKALKDKETVSPVKEWIPRQYQSELDALGIGLRGGKPDGYVNITPRQNK